jgi:hypothetical protein
VAALGVALGSLVGSALGVALEAALEDELEAALEDELEAALEDELAATATRGTMASSSKNIPAWLSHLVAMPPVSLRLDKADLLFDGAGVRVGRQLQGFAWQRLGILRGNAPTTGNTG